MRWREQAIAPISDEPAAGDTIRVWVAGCATGEEAYSLAILMLEEAAGARSRLPIQIFASDLDEGALAIAREGRYPKAIEADVSEERLKRFFVDEGDALPRSEGGARLVLFATHSVLKDPPFIAARPGLLPQPADLSRARAAAAGLRPVPLRAEAGGFLFLGLGRDASTRAPDLFTPCDREARIYRARRAAGTRPRRLPPAAREQRPRRARAARVRTERADKPDRRASHRHARSRMLRRRACSSTRDATRRAPVANARATSSCRRRGPFTPRCRRWCVPSCASICRRALHRALERDEPTLTLPIRVASTATPRRVVMQCRAGRRASDARDRRWSSSSTAEPRPTPERRPSGRSSAATTDACGTSRRS